MSKKFVNSAMQRGYEDAMEGMYDTVAYRKTGEVRCTNRSRQSTPGYMEGFKAGVEEREKEHRKEKREDERKEKKQ